jgi:thioredoxin 1
MASEHTHEFTDANFDAEVMGSDAPVLVDFWAEWCQPCKMLAPTIDEVASHYGDRAKVGKIDIDENKETAMKFSISAIPTVMIFKNGEVAKQFVGMTRKEDIVEAMDALV